MYEHLDGLDTGLGGMIMKNQVSVHAFYDEDTSTLTYVVSDPKTKDAVVIDPVLDYDPSSSKARLDSVKDVLSYVEEESLTVHYILETHAHADHLSGSQFFKRSVARCCSCNRKEHYQSSKKLAYLQF